MFLRIKWHRILLLQVALELSAHKRRDVFSGDSERPPNAFRRALPVVIRGGNRAPLELALLQVHSADSDHVADQIDPFPFQIALSQILNKN